MIRPTKIFQLLVLVVSTGFFSTVSAAENKTSTGKKDVTTLNEVVVTAKTGSVYKAASSSTGSKTDIPLREIPAAVVVVPEQLLQDQTALTMNEAMRNVSGATPVMGGGYGFANRYLVRGLSQRYLRDGLTDGPSMNGYTRTMWDVDTLEVLKGPGSAVYGRGEPGGTINVVTKKPLDQFAVEVGGTVGAFDTYEAYIDLGGPLAEGLDSRFIAGYQHTDGFRDLERDIWAVLPTVSWKLDADQTWTLDYDHRSAEIIPDNYGILFRNGQLIAVDRENKYYSPFNTTDQDIDRVALTHEWNQNDSFTLRNAFVYDNRDLYILRNASGTVNNTTGQFTGRNAREQTDDFYDFSYEIEAIWKFMTGSWLHALLGGFEYDSIGVDTVRRDIVLGNIDNIYIPIIPEGRDASSLARTPAFDRRITADTASFYVQDQIELNEQWKARGGARFDTVWFEDDGFSKYPLAASPYVYRDLDFDKSLLSWQAGLVYQPLPDLSLYGGVSEGRFINIQTESTNLTEIPEESSQIELGIKKDWWDGKWSTSAALFQTTRDNYYVTPFGGGNSVPEGSQETVGVEFDLNGNPYPGWEFYGNVALYDAEFASDQLSGATNLKGKDPQSVPQHQASVWLQYEVQCPALKGWGAGVGSTYQGRSYADSLNVNKVPGYWIGDLALFYRFQNQEFRLSVKNFTDEKYFTNATFSGALPGEPLNVNLSYKAKF